MGFVWAMAWNPVGETVEECCLSENVEIDVSIKIRATHEVMTTRAAQFALFIVKLVAAAGIPTPMLARGVFAINPTDFVLGRVVSSDWVGHIVLLNDGALEDKSGVLPKSWQNA